MSENKTIGQGNAGQSIVSIDRGSQLPMYRQIYEGIRLSILDGRIARGERLPSIRELAQYLSVSRLTVLKSLIELANKGYVQTISGVGSFVIHGAAENTMSFQPPNDDQQEHPPIRFSSFAHGLMANWSSEPGAAPEVETNNVAPPFDELPIDCWQKLSNQATRIVRAASRTHSSSPTGCARLRQTLADYLRRARGVECSTEQIVVFSQPETANYLICRLLLNPGDAAAVENPGGTRTRNVLAFHGARVVPISVDAEGLVVQCLYDSAEGIKVVFVTPSHHDPTGVELSLSRRFELLRWARQRGALIVEEDDDAAFRYGDPTPPMVHTAGNRNVIYRYDFGKTLFPLLRAGFLVLPAKLVPLFEHALHLLEFEISPFEQIALADFIAEGHYERYLKRIRNAYATRRAYLVQALTVNFGKAISIANARLGRRLLVWLQSDRSDEFLLACARKAGLQISSTGSSYLCEPKRGEFLINCSHLSEEDTRRSVNVFAALTKAGEDQVERLPASWFQSNQVVPKL